MESRLLSDAIKLAKKKNKDIDRKIRHVQRVTNPDGSSGFKFLTEYKQVWNKAGTTGSNGYGTTTPTLDFAQYVPQHATLAHCYLHLESVLGGGSSTDPNLGVQWSADGSPDWVPLFETVSNYSLVDNASPDYTVNVQIPLTSSKTGKVKYIEAASDTWEYTITVYGYS